MADDGAIRLTKEETVALAACLCDKLAERLRDRTAYRDHSDSKNAARRITELVETL